MLGAIAGEIIGSVYEFHPIKTQQFPLFSKGSAWTDDTVLTMAVAETLLTGRPYEETLCEFALANPDAGFGGMFRRWFNTPGSQPYNSFGNGSAMRVSPVGWAFETLKETLAEAQKSAEATHNHPEGIKGAQAVAAAIFLARHGSTQLEIRDALEQRFGYDLHRTYEEIQPPCFHDETCQRSVPEALFGGVPVDIAKEARARLTPQFISILDAFQEKYGISRS
jgi:ADP-ribosyl-[dinitrogen reductase] hydrolase